MNKMDMMSNSVAITIADKVADAPTYGKDVTLVQITRAIIVKNGTVNGRCTIDIQLIDSNGNKYVAMTTGAIVSMLAGAVVGAESAG